MTDEQLRAYRKFETSLAGRELPDEVRRFLLVLREHLMLSGLQGSALARQAARREPTPPAGRARVGHDRYGRFSARRLSDELAGRDRLPRPALVEVIAKAYAAAHGEPAPDIRERLLALHEAAATANDADKTRREQAALDAGRRFPTHAELIAARTERDTLRTRLDQAERRLAGLQQRYQELATTNQEQSSTISGLHTRISELLDEVDRIRGALAERERDVADGRAAHEETEKQRLALRAQVDRLTATTDELRRRIDTAQGVRQDTGPDSPSRPLTGDDTAHPSPGSDSGQDGDAQPAEMIPGINNTQVQKVVDDLWSAEHLLFYPETETAASYPDLPRRVLLHIWATALALGVLSFPPRATPWRRGFSSASSNLPYGAAIPLAPCLAVIVTGALAALTNEQFRPSGAVGGIVTEWIWWAPWVPAYLVLGAGIAVVCVPRARRFLSRWTLVGSALGALGVAGIGLTYLTDTIVGGEVWFIEAVAAFALVAAARLAGRAMTRVKEIEQFLDELIYLREHDVYGPSDGLQDYILTKVRSSWPSANGHHRNSGPGLSKVDDSRLHATHFASGYRPKVIITRIRRTPSVLIPGYRPAVGARELTAHQIKTAVPVCAINDMSRVTWLWHDGDYVHAGEPIAVSYRVGQASPNSAIETELHWTHAPTDGVFVAWNNSRDVFTGRRRAVALIVPGWPIPAQAPDQQAPVGTSPADRAGGTSSRRR